MTGGDESLIMYMVMGGVFKERILSSYGLSGHYMVLAKIRLKMKANGRVGHMNRTETMR